MSQTAKFVAETVDGEDRFTMFLDGELVRAGKRDGGHDYNLSHQLPVPGSIEKTIDAYKANWPEDTVDFVDNRAKN